MKTLVIYKIRNLLNGKVYIGQSSNLKNRFNGHNHHVKTKVKHPLYDSIRCYGIENFELVILEWINDINQLDEREQYWMDFYKSYDKDYGYNLRSKAESNKGYKYSEEHKINQYIAQKKSWSNNRIAWNKGLKCPEEQKLKVSNKLKGRIFSKEDKEKMRLGCIERSKNPEYIKKLSDARKGYKPSEEIRKKMSLAKIGTTREFTEEHRKNLSLAMKGKPKSEEHKRKNSESHKGRISPNKGKKLSEEHKKKIGLGNKGKVVSKEAREKISNSMKEKYKDPNYVTKRKNGILFIKALV